MRSMFSVMSVLFVGLIGCRTGDYQVASRPALASNTGANDPGQICPAICGTGTLCEMSDGSCTEVCNSCYCMREGGTVVEACPKEQVTPREFQSTELEQVAASDGASAR